jgi:uncharacterized SAM-binding protein YcdF (DUF218 family)
MQVRSRKVPFVIVAILVVALLLTKTLWLGALGAFLIHADQPMQADYAVVLAGDHSGNRILEAAELVRRGMVRKALVDGPMGFYGFNESDLAVNFAIKKGYPEDYFVKLPMEASSTRQEARLVMAELRSRGAHSFLLVTSDYHTRRAGGLFRQISDGLEMRVIAAPDEHFHWDSWWRDREAQKTVYMEWSKTVASWFGI